MAIIIPHRFIDRLIPHSETNFINAIIIGTFNPGVPNLNLLTNEELNAYEIIRSRGKFRRFNEVRNFYDRPQNRFWKIMDVFNNPSFYALENYKAKNRNGLKYYKGYNRDTIFLNQQLFCQKHGLFITDIVKRITPESFSNVYDNFPDSIIEKATKKEDWNTDNILDIIKKYQPKHILINFKIGKNIPNISAEIEKIKKKYPDKISQVMSTSGAAGNTYNELIENWHSILFNT